MGLSEKGHGQQVAAAGRRLAIGTIAWYSAVVMLAALVTHTGAQVPFVAEIVDVEFDVRGDDTYKSFFGDMHVALQSNTRPFDLETDRSPHVPHYILPVQTPHLVKPPKWIKVMVQGDSGRSAFLLFTADTVYMWGFISGDGTMYCTFNRKDLFPIDGCVPLPFKDTYRGLLNKAQGVDINPFLGQVLLGRTAARAAASVLADYQHNPASTSELLEPVRRSMIVFVLMTAEAVKFKPISETCKSSWIGGGFLKKAEYDLLFTWKTLSTLWCREDDLASESDEWTLADAQLKRLNIKSLADIDARLDIVKNENKCKDKRVEEQDTS